MHTMAEGIAAALRESTPPPSPPVPTARELMQKDGVVFRREHPVLNAIDVLYDRRLSGAPVIEGHDTLIGFLSEQDCLRVIADGAYHGECFAQERSVGEVMSTELTTIPETLHICDIADVFIRSGRRLLPVVEGTRLLGQISRRDVLAAVRKRARGRRFG